MERCNWEEGEMELIMTMDFNALVDYVMLKVNREDSNAIIN